MTTATPDLVRKAFEANWLQMGGLQSELYWYVDGYVFPGVRRAFAGWQAAYQAARDESLRILLEIKKTHKGYDCNCVLDTAIERIEGGAK